MEETFLFVVLFFPLLTHNPKLISGSQVFLTILSCHPSCHN